MSKGDIESEGVTKKSIITGLINDTTLSCPPTNTKQVLAPLQTQGHFLARLQTHNTFLPPYKHTTHFLYLRFDLWEEVDELDVDREQESPCGGGAQVELGV